MWVCPKAANESDRTLPLSPAINPVAERLLGEVGMASHFRRHPQDSPYINLDEDWDVRYWSDRWCVPRQQLTETVRRVGSQVRDVARALGKDS